MQLGTNNVVRPELIVLSVEVPINYLVRMVSLRLVLPDYLLSTCGHRQEHFQFVVASVTVVVSYAVNLCL